MKSLTLTLALLMSLPALAETTLLWTCTARPESFFANPFFHEMPEQRLAVEGVPTTQLSLLNTDEGRIFANLDLSGTMAMQVRALPVEPTLITREQVGEEPFERSLDYLSVMLDSQDIKRADAYRSYPLEWPESEVELVGLEFLSQNHVIGRALMYTEGEFVGSCN